MGNIYVELNTGKYGKKRLDKWVENMKQVAIVLDVCKTNAFGTDRRYNIYSVLIKSLGTDRLNDACIEDLTKNHPEVMEAHDTRFDKWT